MFEEHYEEFTEKQMELLNHFVTNTTGQVFVLRNLPEVIKGALFSRYSRSTLGLRSLLLKEFIGNDAEAAFSEIAGGKEVLNSQIDAIKKAQSFYDRILDGYGDDSIGELGGAHMAIENISMLAAKVIQDARIGGSPLEKSTRYIYFDQKINGEYLFYREPVILTSAYRDLYLSTCNHLFDVYQKLIPPLTASFEAANPRAEEVSKTAYNAAIRAKVLDCLRGLLPTATLTNMGVFGNGRFFEGVLHKLNAHPLAELKEIGRRSYEELSKVIPSFVRRGDPEHHTDKAYQSFHEKLTENIAHIADKLTHFRETSSQGGVRLLYKDEEGVNKVAAALLFAVSDKGLFDLKKQISTLKPQEIAEILQAAASSRKNRRQKSPRALENATFTFEIIADFGIYRDLHRHRMLTQERQLLTCHLGYYIPKELIGTPFEADYRAALEKAKEAYLVIAEEFPEEAQYIVPMAYNIRWYFTLNLRALQWLTELRSQAAGHAGYRFVAQEMARLVSEEEPLFAPFFKFVDFEGHELGRLSQEIRKEEKLKVAGA